MILGCYYHNMRGEELKNFRKISKSFVNRWQRTNLKLATRPSAPKQVIGRFAEISYLFTPIVTTKARNHYPEKVPLFSLACH